MTCKHCGSDRHPSEECPALHLTRLLLGQPYEEKHLPDYASVMEFDDLLEKTEDELHDETVNLKKVNFKKRGSQA